MCGRVWCGGGGEWGEGLRSEFWLAGFQVAKPFTEYEFWNQAPQFSGNGAAEMGSLGLLRWYPLPHVIPFQ